MKLNIPILLTTWLTSTTASVSADPIYSRCSTIQNQCWASCKNTAAQTAVPIDAVWPDDTDNWSWLADWDNEIIECEIDEDCPDDDSNAYTYQSNGKRGGCGP